MDLVDEVKQSIASGPGGVENALDRIVAHFGAVTATIHRADAGARMLLMVAWRGLPEKLVQVTSRIPYGKGMAGICVERAEAIDVCNLQTDNSGMAKISARETGVAGAICVPILDAAGTVAGTLGVGKPGEHTYTAEEKDLLLRAARALVPALS
jgi:putative methionine-R-sulfoxide reductase with GAF domain